MSNRRYDVAIIGGGIQGAGISQAVAAAGYSCLILEKSDWASATSRCSSKLIHGGLRYLESAQWSLVRESLKEREILLNIAPDLVKPKKFFIPIYRHSQRRPWQIRIGLILYWLFNFRGKYRQFGTLSKQQWPSIEGLETKNLQTVFWYWDAQTDDRLLTEAVIASAEKLSATAINNACLQNAEKEPEGYRLNIQQSDQQQTYYCRVLINATGPWINQTLSTITPNPETLAVDFVQGAHVILDSPICEHILYLESPDDQRAIFVMPWQGKTLLGTTETLFSGNPDDAQASSKEEAYLLRTLKYHFPTHIPKIIDRFAGIRVLPKRQGNVFSRPRETLFHSAPNHPKLISVYGGKLTGYRASAEKALEIIQEKLGERTRKANTKSLKLPST
jgi:glycerol-3-phosphate dehydrogenase